MRRRTIQKSAALAALALGLFACGSWTAPEAPPASVLPAAPPNGSSEPSAGEPEPVSTSTPSQFPALTIVVGKDPCSTDADCVPATCCLPEACVAKSKGPDCSAVRCMHDCSKPRVDCGGACLCQGGFCAARLGTTP